MKNRTSEQILMRDNFVEVLGLKKVSASLKHREQRDALYSVILEFLASENAAAKAPESAGPGDLALRIPGTGVHVRLTGIVREGLLDVVTAFLLLPSDRRSVAAGIAVLNRIRANISLAKKATGERCVLEAIGEVDEPTANKICLQLLDLPCRYLTAGCQYTRGTGFCGFHMDAVNSSLKMLEGKKVLEHTAAEPYSWTVIV